LGDDNRNRDIMHFVTLTFIVGGRGIVMGYHCAKFGDFGLSRFGFNHVDDRYTDVTTVCVSNNQRHVPII